MGKEYRRTADAGRRKVFAVPFFLAVVIALSMAFSMSTLVPEAEAIPFMGSGGYFVTLEYRVHFDTHSSGDLYLFFGTTEKEGMESGAEGIFNLSGMPNQVMLYLMGELFGEAFAQILTGIDNDSMVEVTGGVLHPGKDMELREPSITVYAGGENMGIEMETYFEVPGAGSKVEYEYLKFLHKGDLAKDPNVQNQYSKWIDNKDYVKMKVEIDCSDTASMTFAEEDTAHLRSRNGEEYEKKTTYTQFILDENELMLHGEGYKSPSTIFNVFVAVVSVGYVGLAAIWFLNRFKGRGLILPGATIIYSGLVWLGYFLPGISIYSIGATTFYIISAVFIGSVAACYFFNPRPREFEGYDKMKEEELESVKIPEVEIPDVDEFLAQNEVESERGGRDHYEVLGVDRSASADEVKKAYLSRIKEYHPDKYQDAPERIRMAAEEEASTINDAYEDLMKALGYSK